MASIILDLSKYNGVFAGTWADTTIGGGYGKWTIDGTDFQGLYQPSNVASNYNVYKDVNRNGIVDAVDKLVGSARLLNNSTGGRGTWSWSIPTNRGDFFGSNGQDVGDLSSSGVSLTELNADIKWDATLGIIFLSTPQEGAGVFTTTINLTAGTQTTGNLAEGAPVWWKVTGITADDLVSGALSGTGTITNGKLDIQHSLKVDADTGEKFEVSVYSDSDRTQQIGTTKSTSVLEAPRVRGNSLYTIVDGPSWTQAEANSVKLGGHLVTINNSNENEYIWTAFDIIGGWTKYYGEVGGPDPNAESYWIGYSDEVKEGNWIWSSGESSNYSNWHDETSIGGDLSPNGGTSENYGYIGGIKDRTWDDGPAYGAKGISETPFIRRGDSAYVIVQGPTWEEAEANAVKLGGHLVTINDAAENEWLATTFKDVGRSPLSKNAPNQIPGNGFSLWIGATDKQSEGTWLDATGMPLTYTNWVSNQEPNNVTWYDSKGEDFGALSGSMWNDFGTNPPNSDQAFAGIAEIKLAPNNAPTGTPTLSGITKVGQTITIDKTPIQDADNFTGYTPTYQYNWEVSNDNGTTWTKLTTTDATDNNSTFTLTTAEVGKKVRGLVSYLDGYGTNESVASAESSPIQPAINLDIGSTITTASKTTTLNVTTSRLTLTGTGNINGTGNALNNYLTGNDGNNILDGGLGNDILAGGKGSDTYIVDSIYDTVIENANEGTDLVKSSVNWTLGANLENLTLTGSDSLSGTGNELSNIIIGNYGNNTLDGGAGNDTLEGNSGNDTLIGGLGNDVMKGGAGNDTYYVDSTGDIITDTSGTDTVVASISWTLGLNLENLTLTGSDPLTGIGNSLKNTIIGNAGNNVLDGMGGTDSLTGGAGADTFRFSTRPNFGASTADHITDFKASEGDLLQISKSAVGLASNSTATVTTISSASELSTALGSATTFVYDSSNGNLYWNQNGIKSGFGSGGIFAVLDNHSALSTSNISLV